MEYLPLFVDIKNAAVLVVGGGEVAFRKVNLLRKANASISVCAPTLCAGLETLERSKNIWHINDVIDSVELSHYRLIIAATNDMDINASVAKAAKEKNILVNVVDQPALCSFILPSVVDRSPVIVAVSSSGASPILARTLRAQIETLLPEKYGLFADMLNRYRATVKAKISSFSLRKRFWNQLIEGSIPELVYLGKTEEAKEHIEQQVESFVAETQKEVIGDVALIGAGPGDPDLLTFRALRLMQRADVVFYDRLVSDAVMDLVRREAECVYVGKKRDYHQVRQDEINQLLVKYAKQGKHVVRLKGGDPFIFGRGGEEIESLAENNIPFQIVPGITAASGCASYAGIPLTHRDYAQSVQFLTGQFKDPETHYNWSALTQPNQTLVFYMALNQLEPLCQAFLNSGLKSDMPVALVEKGTTENQRVFVATIESIVRHIEDENIHAPTLLIVGEVVQLHEKYAWFDSSAGK